MKDPGLGPREKYLDNLQNMSMYCGLEITAFIVISLILTL